jgi:hypothetical protein
MIDKLTFCEVIEDLRQQIYFDRTIGIAIQTAFGSESTCSYKDDLAIKAIMKLLQLFFPKDKHGFCEIEHYCMHIEFGKIGEKDLITSEDLYDRLVSNKK